MPRKRPPTTVQIGINAPKHAGGRIQEEWHPNLRGAKAAKIFEEMRDNDAIVGAVLYTIESYLRKMDWDVVPANDTPEALKEADFLRSCMNDMDAPWQDFISDVLSFLPYGYSLHEIVYKIRVGPQETSPRYRSDATDHRVGWRALALRPQSSIDRWEIDPVTGEILGAYQCPPLGLSVGPEVFLPAERCALFRTRPYKNNPEGRALDPNTPIPTPDGWQLLDDLTEGSRVFDEEGKIRYVTARADWEDRPAYRVRFSDGSEIIADENHQWFTQNQYERLKRLPGRIRTTQQIAQRLKTSTGTSNHAVPWAAPIEYAAQHQPIDPYIFGLWLGDGSSNSATLASHEDDVEEVVGALRRVGLVATVRQNGKEGGRGRSIGFRSKEKWGAACPARQLRAMGVANNKHVPDYYLRGSIEQRRALLAGLMDSAGHIVATGQCEFTNTNQQLSTGVAEIVRSLGISAYVTTKINDHGNTVWLVKFTPDFPPFRLARKIARCKTARARKYHYVVAVEPVTPRRTVCIEVDSPSHLFLAGRGMVPTHNSILRNAYRAWYLKKKLEEIEAIGLARDLNGLVVMQVPPQIMSPNASAAHKATRAAMEDAVSKIHRDELEGIVVPSELEPGESSVATGYKLTLLSTSGGKQVSADPIIRRYDARIAMSMAAEFLILGTEKQGSFALGAEKSANFLRSLYWYGNTVAATLNKGPVKRLYDANDVPIENRASIQPGELETPDLMGMSQFLTAVAGNGLLHATPALEERIREIGGLPKETEDLEALFAEEKAAEAEKAKAEADALAATVAATAAVPKAPPGKKPAAKPSAKPPKEPA